MVKTVAYLGLRENPPLFEPPNNHVNASSFRSLSIRNRARFWFELYRLQKSLDLSNWHDVELADVLDLEVDTLRGLIRGTR
jgi:hypothetical protein